MAEMNQITWEAFLHAVERGVTLVDFNAPWCAPCRALEPVIGKLERDYSGRAAVLKINIDENRDIAMELGIQSIPTIIVYKNGKECDRFIGLQTAAALARSLDDVLAAGHHPGLSEYG